MIGRSNGTRAKDKICGFEDLAPQLEVLRDQGNRVVHCHGVFDLLHVGHIRHLEEARGLGDVLVVTITPDIYVNKGPHRPAFSQELRAEAIAALDCVDYVVINNWPTAVDAIGLLRPNYYVKGSDYSEPERDITGGIGQEEAAVRAAGGQLVFTDDITFSSSNIINRHLSAFPKETSDFLLDFSSRHPTGQILGYLESAAALRVLVIGESIIDEYHYCETMGKSGKDPILAVRYLESEKFGGGVLAVANHIAKFSNNVSLLTFLGSSDSQEEFICEQLDPKINKTFLYQPNQPTIVKRRFVEIYPFQKLFEVYLMGDGEGDEAQSEALCARLEEVLPNFDVVVVMDYGHGMISAQAVEVLCNRAPFLAVNVQANSHNHGFNTISKYPRADYICISESEVRLDVRGRRRDLNDIVLDVSERLGCDNVLITFGDRGCLSYSKEDGFSQIPAFTTNVVDRTGAGDAVFSVTSLCVAQKAQMDVVGFVGNSLGAQAVATVGHRNSTDRVALFKQIESLLK